MPNKQMESLKEILRSFANDYGYAVDAVITDANPNDSIEEVTEQEIEACAGKIDSLIDQAKEEGKRLERENLVAKLEKMSEYWHKKFMNSRAGTNEACLERSSFIKNVISEILTK